MRACTHTHTLSLRSLSLSLTRTYIMSSSDTLTVTCCAKNKCKNNSYQLKGLRCNICTLYLNTEWNSLTLTLLSLVTTTYQEVLWSLLYSDDFSTATVMSVSGLSFTGSIDTEQNLNCFRHHFLPPPKPQHSNFGSNALLSVTAISLVRDVTSVTSYNHGPTRPEMQTIGHFEG